MKLWYGHGSEHSQNLVMIGRFKEARDAEHAASLIDDVTALVQQEIDAGRIEVGSEPKRYPEQLMKKLWDLKVHSVGPAELEQFAYDVRVEHKGNQVVITTDEIEVSAFLKVLIDARAKVEVYSAHFWTDDGDTPDSKQRPV